MSFLPCGWAPRSLASPAVLIRSTCWRSRGQKARTSRPRMSSVDLPTPDSAAARRRIVVTPPPTRTGAYTDGGQQAGSGLHRPRDETEVGPFAALFTLEDPGVDE